MDITLSRILSLIEKKPDGTFVHGAFKDFAQSIGYKNGDIVSIWIQGNSKSYNRKLHEIAAKYDVSVEWLRGETDEKTPVPAIPGTGTRADELRRLIFDLTSAMSEEELEHLYALLSRVHTR